MKHIIWLLLRLWWPSLQIQCKIYIKCYESTERSNKTLVESVSIVIRKTLSLRIASFSTITWFIWYFIWYFLRFSPILLQLSLLLLRLFYRVSSFLSYYLSSSTIYIECFTIYMLLVRPTAKKSRPHFENFLHALFIADLQAILIGR